MNGCSEEVWSRIRPSRFSTKSRHCIRMMPHPSLPKEGTCPVRTTGKTPPQRQLPPGGILFSDPYSLSIVENQLVTVINFFQYSSSVDLSVICLISRSGKFTRQSDKNITRERIFPGKLKIRKSHIGF